MELERLLIEKYGYNPKNVGFMARELRLLDGVFKDALEKWINTGEAADAGTYYDYSIERLMRENKMNYPAALTTLYWIACEGEKAIALIRKGVK